MSSVVLLIEGATEKAASEKLKEFLDERCTRESRPKVRLLPKPLSYRVPERDFLYDRVAHHLKNNDVLGVVVLMDVKCAGPPLQFQNASEAIGFLQSCVPNEPRYRAHAAQFDFEAWLLPYWDSICRKLGVSKQPPGENPELVDLISPPSTHLKNLYRAARRDYHKPRDARAILKDKDLTVSANKCPQFKAFLNSLLHFAGCSLLE